jgi:hypothetical protein
VRPVKGRELICGSLQCLAFNCNNSVTCSGQVVRLEPVRTSLVVLSLPLLAGEGLLSQWIIGGQYIGLFPGV